MSFLPGLFPALISINEKFPYLSYRARSENTGNLTAYTFSGISIGTADASRVVVVHIASANTATGARGVNSVTIGAVSATKAVDEGGVSQYVSELWYAVVPSGSTANIVVTHNGAMASCSIAVWALYDLASSTPTAVAFTIASSTTIDIAARGIVIAGFHTASSSTTLSGVNMDFEDITLGDVAASGHSGGSRVATNAETGTTISSSGTAVFVAAAAWR